MIQLNLLATLLSPLCHLSGEQHVWHENGDLRAKRVVRLHMRKTLNYPSQEGMRHTLLPMYQGNSWRGLLRYHLGLTILDQLQDHGIPITKHLFSHLLGSGGLISSNSNKDALPLASFYDRYPNYWLFGGTFNGKLYRGHSSMGDWIPICQEAIANHTVPDRMSEHAIALHTRPATDAYRTPFTNITTITRRDPKLRPDLLAMIDDKELEALLEEYQKAKTARAKSKTVPVAQEPTQDPSPEEGSTAAEQQIIATETVMEGTPLFGQMAILDGEGPREQWANLEQIGFGCLLIALERFSRTPFVGGGYRQGFGRIDLRIDVALRQDHVVSNGITLTHIDGVPLFQLHPDLQPYRKAGEEAIGRLVTQIKAEKK